MTVLDRYPLALLLVLRFALELVGAALLRDLLAPLLPAVLGLAVLVLVDRLASLNGRKGIFS